MRPVNRYPSVDSLHKAARKKLPKFSYDYVDGGSGSGVGLDRNYFDPALYYRLEISRDES